MRRILATLTVLVACPARRYPATAHAAPAPIGGGSDLFTVGGGRCTAAFAATGGGIRLPHRRPGLRGDASAPSLQRQQRPRRPGRGDHAAASAGPGHQHRRLDAGAVDRRRQRQGPDHGLAETPVGGSVCLLRPDHRTRCGTITAKNQTDQLPRAA